MTTTIHLRIDRTGYESVGQAIAIPDAVVRSQDELPYAEYVARVITDTIRRAHFGDLQRPWRGYEEPRENPFRHTVPRNTRATPRTTHDYWSRPLP